MKKYKGTRILEELNKKLRECLDRDIKLSPFISMEKGFLTELHREINRICFALRRKNLHESLDSIPDLAQGLTRDSFVFLYNPSLETLKGNFIKPVVIQTDSRDIFENTKRLMSVQGFFISGSQCHLTDINHEQFIKAFLANQNNQWYAPAGYTSGKLDA